QLDVKMSDTQGRYRFLLSSGTYRMKVDYQGYTFPAKQQRNVISTQTGEKFVEFNIQKGKPVNISLGLDPS
ncbi:hypothetical protein KC909_06020, partial [Candidatus Dojkabacteria bacterium]|nr:hypothetical protein [Candidatus Dojkabacteria bacterium]